MADRTSLQPPIPQPYQDPYLQHHLHHRPLEPQTPLEQYRGTGIGAAPRTTLPDSSLYSGGSNERYKGVGGGRSGYVDIHGHSRGDNCSDVDGRDGYFGAQKASYCNRGVLDDSVGQGEHFGNYFEGPSLGYASQRDDGCDGDDSSASGSGGDTYHRTDEGCNRDDVFHRTDEGCKSSRDDVFYSNSRDYGCEEKTEEGSNTRDEAFHRTDDIRNDVFPGTDEGCNRDDVFYRTDEGCSNRDDVFYRTDEGCNRDDVLYSREYVCEERGDGSDGYRDSGSHDGGNNTTDYLYNRTASFGYSVDNTGMKNSLRRVDDFGGDCDDFGGRRSNLDPLEAQLKPGSWVSPTPPDRGAVAGEGRERGGGYPQDWAFLYSHSQAAGGAGGRVYQQKLDSFSEAFSFRHNVAGSRILNSGNSRSGILGLGGGSTVRIKTSAYDSHTDSSTLPSPPTPPPPSPHPFPQVLSPPPTPLPPHSLSPPKLTPPPSVRTVGLTQSSGGGCSGTVQFYPSSLQPLHSSHPSAVVWKLPLSHWLQQSGDVGVVEGNPSNSGYVYCQEAVFPGRPGHQDNGNNTDHYSLQTLVESSFTSTPAFHSALHPSSLPSQPPIGQNGTAPLEVHKGTPFPSLLQSSRGGGGGGQKGVERLGRGLHYTPLPMLNPRRRGTGILSSLMPPSVRERGMGGMTEEEEGYSIPPCINVGPGFQAELPCCLEREEESRTWPEESASNEELLWKPWEELGKSSVIQDQVAAMLSVCSSSCLPGGGSNTELALHCLYLCHGDTLATLEKLLFSTPSSARDYHYAGSDVWLQTERCLFSKALTSHGKDFPLIQQMVKTKCVSQCVEFYYLSKRLPDKQRKQREQEQMSVVSLPKPMEVVVPAPSLATSFPCKQCGKMFYKIKSRNAHMKIHRQQQDDWRHPGLGLNPAQNLTSNLGTNLPHCQASGRAYLPGPINNNSIHHIGGAHTIISDISVPNTNTVTNSNSVTVNDSTSNQRGPAPLLSLHHSWDSFQVNSDPAAVFFCDPEVKAVLGVMAGGVKGQILWN
ncbi:uncharacterized protein LOC112239230 [Oncorhynchus tshawytscha]|nr:uncharacterized protein LOC112239230 [Oncorhynchus tshawytscha]XP_042185287.1 uncharacterized protein LOC112239230 [Oncorhynchus tshawytscha]XP_042185288.1 uncharacterized protein LOC112239230 [Oncorhynchus tshawytscha]